MDDHVAVRVIDVIVNETGGDGDEVGGEVIDRLPPSNWFGILHPRKRSISKVLSRVTKEKMHSASLSDPATQMIPRSSPSFTIYSLRQLREPTQFLVST